MFSRWIRRVTGAFSFRLNVYYAAFFGLVALAFFAFAYVELLSLLRKKDREVVKTELEQLVRKYERGGAAELQGAFADPRELEKNIFFIRLIAGPDAQPELLVIPTKRRDFNLESIELPSVKIGDTEWRETPVPDRSRTWVVYTTQLPDGRLLQVGARTSDRRELLASFAGVFGQAIVQVVMCGSSGPW